MAEYKTPDEISQDEDAREPRWAIAAEIVIVTVAVLVGAYALFNWLVDCGIMAVLR